jgi:8-amino-7-oxononanoate synthase
MDTFEKCRAFYADAEYARGLGYPSNPRTLDALGLYPYFIPVAQTEGTEVLIRGRRRLMLGSNNYLGLTHHPRVVAAAEEAVRRFGTACTGSRFLNGTLDLHLELESRLARFLGKEAALVFTTGYQACLSAISGLLGRSDVVIADREVHASLIDGFSLARERKGTEIRFFRHGDVGALERRLARVAPEQGALVVVDGVFSMSGDVAPLPEIAAACRRHGARLLVDDAHGLGVLGEGRGTAAHLGCTDDVDLIVGTFSKSLASTGGFVAGPREVVQWLQHFARPFIFTASLSAAQTAAAGAALDVIREEPGRVRRLGDVVAHMRKELRGLGYPVADAPSAIIPIVIGDQFRAVQAWRDCLDRGVYTNVALPPAVPPRGAALRTSYMATHSDAQLESALTTFRHLRERMSRRAAAGPQRGEVASTRSDAPAERAANSGAYID